MTATMNRPESVSLPSPYFREEHELLRAQIRRFVETEIKPHGLKWEEQGYVPREVLRRMGELGFLGIRYPAEYGGSEMDTLGSIVLAEELGRSTFSGVAITVLVHTDMASVHMANAGTPAQKARWMPEIVAGPRRSPRSRVTEPDAGSDVKGIRTTARRDGDHYVLNGAKMFITNGVHADLYFVAAKTSPDARPSQQISMFMVEKGTPGFTVSRALDKHGWRSSDTAELVVRGLPHPGREPARQGRPRLLRHHEQLPERAHRDRRDGDGRGAGRARSHARLRDDAQGLRRARSTRSRRIRQRLAMLAAKVEAGRQLVYHAAWLDAQGVDCTREVSMVKAYCGELVNEVMYACLQFHGGMGFMREIDDRAHGARRARADDRRRRHRSDAGRGRQAPQALDGRSFKSPCS